MSVLNIEKTFRATGDKVTADDITSIIEWARYKARAAVSEYIANEGFDVERPDGMCGYSWVEIRGIDGKKVRKNSKADVALVESGVTRNCFNFPMEWRPGGYAGQNIEVHKVGALEFARVLVMNGFDCVPGARFD